MQTPHPQTSSKEKLPQQRVWGDRDELPPGHAGDVRLKRWPMAVKAPHPGPRAQKRRRERPPSSALCPHHLLSRGLPLTAVPAHPSLLYEGAEARGEGDGLSQHEASPVFPRECPSPRFSYRLPGFFPNRGAATLFTLPGH